jgi:formylglycine-generating enzyme required for sulfatase activity/PKD repeat protein
VDITYDLADPDSSSLTVTVAVSTDAGTTWSYPGASLTGQVGSGITPGAGKQVVWNAGSDLPAKLFANVRVQVTADDAAGPSGMALIPASSFTMGNCMDPGEGWSDELPLHTVYVSAFYMDKYLVAKSLWDTVYQWAIAHGYTFDYAGSGKASTHPVQTIDWYDCVKWCNARSEKEGRAPAYYTDVGLSVRYRTGQVAPYVSWMAGYRLPTEAEWEKAARGGVSGQRFPWGNTISWSQANYCAVPGGSYEGHAMSYDVNPTAGVNPTFATLDMPYTSPVGYFAANGYGLYDMAGNAWQWCWDWYGSNASGSQTDPRGPTTGSRRVFRGAGWGNVAILCRTADRYGSCPPTYSYYDVGLRSVLSSGQAGSSTAMSTVFKVDLTGQPPPDLTVENVRFTPASVNIGGTVNVSFRLRHLSGRAAVSPVARVRLTSDAALTESDPGLLPLDVTLPTLTAGTVYYYSGSFTTVPGSLLPGSYYVGVRLDPLAQLGQNNTGNDVAVSVAKLSVVGTGGPSLVVLPATRAVNVEASSTAFSIYNAGGGTMAWTASISAAPWIHLSSGSSAGTGPGVIVVTCDANTLTSPHTGTIVVSAPGASPSSATVTVTQPGAAAAQPPVTTFQFSSTSSPQNVNSPFSVTVQAMNGAVVQTGFNGDVQLTAESGGNVSLRTIRLANGSWSGNLSLDTVTAQTRIIAATASGAQGQSNPFQVQGATTPTISVTIKVVEFMTVPVTSATVLLGRDGETPIQATTDPQGSALFSVAGAGRYNITVQKPGYNPTTSSVETSGMPVSKTIEMHSFRPAVILVPGIMGSCSKGISYPLLPRVYPARQDSLKLFPLYADVVGWDEMQEKLFPVGFTSYPAPWDWRMPVIRPDENGKVAWKEYLLPVIAQVKAETGAQKVDIVAHSMGGLLVRAYIQSAEYAGDIDRFAMVGTPNEGAAMAYRLWFGGDTSSDSLAEATSSGNYKEWTGGDWNALKDSERLQFYRENFKSLEELLPVYADALALGDLQGNYQEMAYPGVESNPLYQMNHGSYANLTPPCTAGTVCTKVFYSTSEQTVRQIRLTPSCSATGVYPHGTPVGEVADPHSGDGTVWYQSAVMTAKPFPTQQFPSGGVHASLVGNCSSAIRDFLLEGHPFSGAVSKDLSDPVITLQTNQLLIAIDGRSQPWITDPASLGAGISPTTGVYSNGWGQAVVEVEASSTMLLRDNPPAGRYAGYLTTFPGEEIGLIAASSLGMTNTLAKQLQWIGTTNEIKFGLQLAASGSNALTLVPELPAPQNLWSFPSEGTCGLAWEALTNANVAGYRIYARRVDESLFAVLATVTNSPFNTGHPWATSASGTNYFYAVVAVSTSGAQSPYATTVMNYVPTLANFSADVVSGTPPLTVAFADHSTGGITNWSWDFNGDGNPDSTEQNPVVTFSQPGTYTVTLTVSGPYGQDTKVSVGYINVVLPSLSLSRLLTNQSVELMLTGQPGRSYDIQVSTDLAAWAFLTNIVPTGSVTPFVDTTAPKLGARFYRAVIP